MAHTRTTTPVRREHLVNEYYGASEAAFTTMEQVEYFSMHARKAKANRDWRDEQELWDAAAHTLYFAIKHRDYELKCRKEEYRLYKQYMSEFERKVQKSIMAYCKRRLYRLRTWESDNLRMKASIVHLDRKIHYERKKFIELQEAREATLQVARIGGARRAHVRSFGNGWEGGSGGQPRAHNEAFEMRQMKYSLSRCQNWLEEKIREREDAIKTWARNKHASDAFQEEWRERDEQARRLLSMYESQRDGRPIPAFDERQASPLLSALGDEDAEGEEEDLWEQDFEQALADGEFHLPHNLLSPTPVNGADGDAVIGEAAFKYAGMKLSDGRQSGLDSGYESGLTSGEGDSTQRPAGAGLEREMNREEEDALIGWDSPDVQVSAQSTWEAAWNTVVPAPGEVKTEDWEYSYAQEG